MDKVAISKLNSVAAEIKSLMTEALFDSAWTIIAMHHEIGRLITQSFENTTEVLPRLSVKVGKSERTLYRSLQLYRKFPDISSIPHGKAISMNRLINENLLESGEPKEEKCHHVCKDHPKL